ncbi:EAL domain-containing protein [Pseudidiomarina insulisalsae]|uniref:Diguanylate cyclase n=1 Tax=Pseudidiomarina insulisalsae TaxID=575789 RepID=A0A432YDS4_9GAMM|nr:EAL domain-containing protein [Pseudidiomarina insulisalsae]RUO58982.1 diguanylate cyclase [Pseudidiomarina insulisalsae]
MPSVVRYVVLGFICVAVLVSAFAPAAAEEPLRVGAYENPPKVKLDENGQLSGVFGDMLYEIARREGWQIKVVPCAWANCLQMLENGNLDLMPDVAISNARDARFYFHEVPVLHVWSQLYSKSRPGVTSMLEVDGARIAVLRDSVQSEFLKNRVANFGIEVTFVEVGSFDEGFAAVLAERADFVAVNHLYGNQHAGELGLIATAVMFQPSRLFFASKPDPSMRPVLTRIDRWLADWRAEANSPYQDIMQKWGVYAGEPRNPVPGWLLPSLLAVLAVAILSVALLRYQVMKKSRALLESEQRSNTILDSVDACIFIKDTDFRYRYANRLVCELFGETETSIIGKSDYDLFDETTADYLRDNDKQVIEKGERLVDEEHNTVQGGQKRQFLTVKIPLWDANDQIYGLCGISTDITEYIEIQEELSQLAYYDSLTGLANRKLLSHQLEHALVSYHRTGFEGAVVALDLIDFNLINDSLGHSAGDRLLQGVAARIQRVVDPTDCVARLGSDDFVVILEDLGDKRDNAVMAARRFAERIVDAVQQPIDLGVRMHTANVCIGVSMFSDSQDGVEERLKNADIALSEAKRLGSGAICLFNPAMQQTIDRRVHLEAALRHAIDERKLQIFLQPQVDVAGKVAGVELLLRWHDDDFGEVSPAEFIPVAESSGLIVPLGNWVVEQACILLQQWSREPQLKDLHLAVNISPRQFRQPDFVDHVASCLQRCEVPRGRLELEITENMLIENVETTIKRMSHLGNLGVRFSLDDFGTGYASLAYLKRLPIYQLKIDQSFVRDVLTDTNDAVIVETILGLGESMVLEVIAEGVETQPQADALRQLGCVKFQGFLYGRPQPVATWLERFQKSLIVSSTPTD